jgi:hypothetical protein
MEQEKSLVKTSEVKLPKFVEQAYDSIEGMKQFANMLLESKLVPDSYYEKGADNKPDYSKGKTSAVVIVLLQAQQLAVPPMTGLQHIVPVNGLLSIKGDLAKTMIFASGKLKKDSWKETVTGSIEEENMVVSLTATREDNGVTLTRTFSVDKAKRMGLWITPAQVNSADGWKWKKSAWFKTPDRMLQYRALGNLARDLFSDVLLNMYTTEEAVDIQREATEIIETADGNKITIPDKEHATKRSEKLTTRVAEKIQPDKFAPVKTEVQEAEVITAQDINEEKATVDEKITTMNAKESPFIPSKGSVEYMNGVKIIRGEDGKIQNMDEVNAGAEGGGDAPEEAPPSAEGPWTLDQMEKMDTKILMAKVNSDTDMMEACDMIGSKNTNKKLREIIFAWQEGTLAEHVAPFMAQTNTPPDDTPAPEDPGRMPNMDFENQKPDDVPLKPRQNKVGAVNKYGMEIPDVEVGVLRDFSDVKRLFNQFVSITPKIDNNRYIELSTKLGFIQKYPDREIFIKSASREEINLLLNNN